MRLRRRWGAGFAVRAVVRELQEMRRQMARQTAALERVAERFAPSVPVVDAREVAATTGVDHLDVAEMGLVLDYITKTEAATGHRPSEEEILIYLADEKTVDLHARLREREREVDQMVANRRAPR